MYFQHAWHLLELPHKPLCSETVDGEMTWSNLPQVGTNHYQQPDHRLQKLISFFGVNLIPFIEQ